MYLFWLQSLNIDINDLIPAADKALYESKQQGRDRVSLGSWVMEPAILVLLCNLIEASIHQKQVWISPTKSIKFS
ncbi:MAG: hypothetical protein NW224_23680 [Leptolyngbyaceae cyanobacterium bins.302]|nr:hypothetical protein [Leptolyngbyaceae cyanobacterium bins.302]